MSTAEPPAASNPTSPPTPPPRSFKGFSSPSSEPSTPQASGSNVRSHSPAPLSLPPSTVSSPQPHSPSSDPHSSIAQAVAAHWNLIQPPETTATPTAASGSPNGPDQPAASNREQEPFRQAHQTWFRNTLSSLGIGRGATPARKTTMSLFWNVSWGIAQVAIVSTLVALTGTVWKTPEGISEWKACDRPLGIWACLWAVRVTLASGLAYWDYVRIRTARQLHPARTTPGMVNSPPTDPASPNASHVNANVDVENPTAAQNSHNTASTIQLPYSHLYSRLTLLSSLFTLSWFLTAHILEYTSINTCRLTSPHLWWLIFGILCIMYVMVLEVLLLGFIVLVLAPILFVFWNLFLFIIGRHPAQNPHMIKPDIGKLPKSIVDRIPLVMYIPPPPAVEAPLPSPIAAPLRSQDKESISQSPNGVHDYPPKSPVLAASSTPSPPKRYRPIFRFFKRGKSSGKEGASASGPNTAPDEEKEQETWEGTFEKSEYPYVVLEGNRAACAICLMDFEEPKRKDGGLAAAVTSAAAVHHLHLQISNAEASTSSSPISPVTLDSPSNGPKLVDAGEGAQPLRLLACGHVFHQTCLDPWLIDVSGRCPVCQRPVEARELKKRKRGNR